MLRLIACFVCVFCCVLAGFNLAVRSMAIHGLMRDPISPLATWLGIVWDIVLATVLLWALTRQTSNPSGD